jgi:YidC/Oxa1 family membrane protein insertase
MREFRIEEHRRPPSIRAVPLLMFAPTAGAALPEQTPNEMFPHLWGWMQTLCIWLLDLLRWLHVLIGNWGVAIIVLSVLVRLALYPFARRALLSQKRYNEAYERLKPELQQIKRDYRGGEQSERILALYKSHELSPIAGVKPLLIVMLQLPIFIALFQILEHAAELKNAPFLWIGDLSRPDQIGHLGFSIPWMGNLLSVLPIVLAITVVLAGVVVPGDQKGTPAHRKRVWGSTIMALAFLVIFYPFPAGLMIYWITNNILQFAQQLIASRSPAPVPAG